MNDPDPHVRINHRLTAAGLGDRFELRLDGGEYLDCTGLSFDEAATLRDELTKWLIMP